MSEDMPLQFIKGTCSYLWLRRIIGSNRLPHSFTRGLFFFHMKKCSYSREIQAKSIRVEYSIHSNIGAQLGDPQIFNRHLPPFSWDHHHYHYHPRQHFPQPWRSSSFLPRPLPDQWGLLTRIRVCICSYYISSPNSLSSPSCVSLLFPLCFPQYSLLYNIKLCYTSFFLFRLFHLVFAF